MINFGFCMELSHFGLESMMDIVEEPIKFCLPTSAIRCTEDLLKKKTTLNITYRKSLKSINIQIFDLLTKNAVEEPIKFCLPTSAIRCSEDLLKKIKKTLNITYRKSLKSINIQIFGLLTKNAGKLKQLFYTWKYCSASSSVFSTDKVFRRYSISLGL